MSLLFIYNFYFENLIYKWKVTLFFRQCFNENQSCIFTRLSFSCLYLNIRVQGHFLTKKIRISKRRNPLNSSVDDGRVTLCVRLMHFITLNYISYYTLHLKLFKYIFCTINYHIYCTLHLDIKFISNLDRNSKLRMQSVIRRDN